MSHKPNFLIVGAMKSGTSTLAFYLRQHPDICMPERELHFFDGRGRFEERWSRGAKWYESQFPVGPSGAIYGEKTPTYSYVPGAAPRIYQLYPNVKIIWIFRNPVDRTYSNYWHYVCHAGKETRSFEQAVKDDLHGREENIWKQYVRRSRYVEQVRRFLDVFDKESMLFLKFSDLTTDISNVLVQTCQFLGVSENKEWDDKPPAKNRTRIPRSLWVRRLVCNIFGRDSVMNRVDKKFNRRAEPGYPSMPEHIRDHLKSHFETSNRELEELTLLDLSTWK